MSKINLKKLFENPKKIVVTAHRGWSGRYPENTLMAFEKAVEFGVDMLEFDLRGTSDGVPVVLHDPTINRTSNGSGSPTEYTLKQLKQFNFSHYVGGCGENKPHLEQALYADCPIPTFEELLEMVPETVGLNIQVYQADDVLLPEIIRLYQKYDLWDRGFLTMSTFDDARAVKKINPELEVNILETQRNLTPADLPAYREFPAIFIQPFHATVTEELCVALKANGLLPNMFFSNTEADNRRFIEMGMQGILTDHPDRLRKTINEMGYE